MRYLLDTSVLSETRKPRPERKVLDWLGGRAEIDIFISVLTLGEIHQGINRLADSSKRDALRNWVDRDLTERFQGRILAVDAEVAAEWGRTTGRALSGGRPLPVVDSLLAATAIVHHLTVATRNVRDLERCGAQVFNPWE